MIETTLRPEALRDALGHARAEKERMQQELQRLRARVAQLQGDGSDLGPRHTQASG